MYDKNDYIHLLIKTFSYILVVIFCIFEVILVIFSPGLWLGYVLSTGEAETISDYIGVDFETGRWFNRNLRIFRNIQRIETGPSDRILVIFGAGHLNLLNYLFECSPEYRLEEANKYLM